MTGIWKAFLDSLSVAPDCLDSSTASLKLWLNKATGSDHPDLKADDYFGTSEEVSTTLAVEHAIVHRQPRCLCLSRNSWVLLLLFGYFTVHVTYQQAVCVQFNFLQTTKSYDYCQPNSQTHQCDAFLAWVISHEWSAKLVELNWFSVCQVIQEERFS